MKIVIEIPEEIYQTVKDETYCGSLYEELKNGIPLPKGHGRLIDADELYGDFIDGTEGYDCMTWNRIEIGDIIEDAPTIIETDSISLRFKEYGEQLAEGVKEVLKDRGEEECKQ